jgi:16S rRNA G527 N7-methylase RsmG
VKSFVEMLAEAGKLHAAELLRSDINRRVNLTEIATLEDIYPHQILRSRPMMNRLLQ